MNKPSKFDEHVDDDQYVDNPLLLLGLANSTQPLTNVTIKESTSSSTLSQLQSANGTLITTPQTNHTCTTNETSTRNSTSTGCSSAIGKNLNYTDTSHLKLIDVDSSNENLHSALVRKRNSADISGPRSTNDSAELPTNDLFIQAVNAATRQPANIYNKNNIYGKFYDYKNASRNFPSMQPSLLRKDNNKTNTLSWAGSYIDTSKMSSYPRYQHVNYSSNRGVNLLVPKIYHKSYFNDANNLFSFKLKKETEDYRMLEKRIRRRNSRVRRSLNMYSLPFNEVIYRRPYRRYRLRNNDRMDIWDHISDHNRRYVRFPLPADASPFRPSRPLSAVAGPPPPPPPPSSINWAQPQLPQYAAYHQSLPPVPSMGPRSPRLVFRDPIEPGTLQAPFSPNGLQDLTAPEDNKGNDEIRNHYFLVY